MTDWMLYCAVLGRYPSNKSACLCIGHFVFGLKWWKQYSDYFVVSPPASPQHRPCTGKWPLPSNTRLATHYHYTALLCHWVAVLPPRTYHPAHSSNVYHPKHCPFQLQPHPSGLCLHKPMPKTHLRWLSWLIEFCFNLLLWRECQCLVRKCSRRWVTHALFWILFKTLSMGVTAKKIPEIDSNVLELQMNVCWGSWMLPTSTSSKCET